MLSKGRQCVYDESPLYGRDCNCNLLCGHGLVTKPCPTHGDPTDSSPPGSSVCGILQARILGLSFPPPGDLSNPGIEPKSLALQAVSLTSEPPGKPLYFNKNK